MGRSIETDLFVRFRMEMEKEREGEEEGGIWD